MLPIDIMPACVLVWPALQGYLQLDQSGMRPEGSQCGDLFV